MKRELPVRFCERLGLKCPCLLDFASPFTQAVLQLAKELFFANSPASLKRI